MGELSICDPLLSLCFKHEKGNNDNNPALIDTPIPIPYHLFTYFLSDIKAKMLI